MDRFLILLTSVLLLAGAGGCGYSWQSRSNPWKEKGVTSVYIAPVSNVTFKAGAEVPFAAALIKEFARGSRIKVVGSKSEADAVVDANLDAIETNVFSATRVSQTAPDNPRAKELDDFVVASEYVVSANLTVRLTRASDGRSLWSQSFTRSKVYQGGNRFGLQGTTSVLINQSQEQLALTEIAQFLAGDAYDAMFEAF